MYEDIKKVDWIHFLDRRRSMFIYFPYIYAEFNLMEKAIGIGYKHHLFKWSGDKGVHYRSKKELKLTYDHFLKICQKDVHKIKHLYDLAMEHDKKAKELLNLFEGENKNGVTLNDFEKYFVEFANILMYTVTIPYVALCAIDEVLEEGKDIKNFEEAKEILEPLRGFTTYPQLERVMLKHFWDLIMEKTGIDDESLIEKATPDEIISFANGGKFVEKEELKKRKKWCIFWHPVDKLDWIFLYDRDLLEKEISVIKDETIERQQIMKGRTATKGFAKGRVARIDNRKDMDNYAEGDIIVSINTSPDLMPALKTCSAVISEEGGIMCHAAIVSRELGKPCIIGVSNVTKILKNGDIVEVNADEGTIKIIS